MLCVAGANRNNIWEMSAVCWFFGRYLYQELGYSIGLIMGAWPATRIRAWMHPSVAPQCYPGPDPQRCVNPAQFKN